MFLRQIIKVLHLHGHNLTQVGQHKQVTNLLIEIKNQMIGITKTILMPVLLLTYLMMLQQAILFLTYMLALKMVAGVMERKVVKFFIL